MSKVCEHNSSACALEQPTSALLLELADLATDVRLDRPARNRCLAEAAEVRYFKKELQRGGMHLQAPWRYLQKSISEISDI